MTISIIKYTAHHEWNAGLLATTRNKRTTTPLNICGNLYKKGERKRKEGGRHVQTYVSEQDKGVGGKELTSTPQPQG